MPQALPDTPPTPAAPAADPGLLQPWRPDWEERKAGKDCPHCALIAASDDQPWGLKVFEGEYVTGILWRAGNNMRGYTVALWNRGHACEPTDLAPAEAAGYWLEVTHLAAAITAVADPAKMNYETLGNAVPHLHTHLIPRGRLDPAPHQPLPGWCFDAEPAPEDVFASVADQIRSWISAHPTPYVGADASLTPGGSRHEDG
ncbi:HIT family protein [Cryptosporangium sp. NPDC048952]|uniref:HIT family protein n=1 Tax=Cryptosporangium sp. NPDC048952 TaxID=3363961 RepID=UPI00371C277C